MPGNSGLGENRGTGLLHQPIMCLAPLIALVSLGVFEPDYLVQMRPSIHFLVRQFVNLGCLLGVVAVLSTKKPPLTCLFVVALCISAEASSISSPYSAGFDAAGVAITYLRYFLCSALFIFWMKECPMRLLFVLSLYFWMICALNLISEVAFPGGLYRAAWTHEPCYLLGHKNSILLALLPGLVSVGLRDVLKAGRSGWRTYLYMLVVLCNVAIAGSSTSTAAIVIALLLAFLYSSWPNIKLGIASICSLGIASSALIVFLKIQEGFAPLLFAVFHKGITFSSRAPIWDKFIALFDGNQILGVGVISNEVSRALTGGVNAHNMLLGVLMTGGLIRLMIYAAAVAIACITVRKYITDSGIRVFLLVLVCLAVLGLMEAFDASWSLLFICALFEGYCLTAFSDSQIAFGDSRFFADGRVV